MFPLPFLSVKPVDPRRYYRQRPRRPRKKPSHKTRLPILYTAVLIFVFFKIFTFATHRFPGSRKSSNDTRYAHRPDVPEHHTPVHHDSRGKAVRSPHLRNTDQAHVTRDSTPNTHHPFRQVTPAEHHTRTCYHSSHTGDALCVHVPFCIRHETIAYLADTLRCSAYTDRHGVMSSLSVTRCVELERELETVAEIDHIEHKLQPWLEQLQASGNILWFEGDTIILRLSQRAKSVSRFADRIFMLHHVLQHPQRYGMGGISNVVIAAHEQVAKKIRYTKSWHHGLLAAMVHPNKLIYSNREIHELVSTKSSRPGEIRVVVPSGIWDIAKGKFVPCFRRAALPGAVRGQFFLTEDIYPGVVDLPAISEKTRFHDADVFRTLLFKSLHHEGPPRIKRHILYLHRSSTRTLTQKGLSLLQEKLRAVAAANSFSFEQFDVSGMTFPQQIEAVAGAGVVVGVHGTQMLNTLFLPSEGAIVEIFPFGFANNLFQNGSGAGIHYASHQILHGDDFLGLPKFRSLDQCLKESKECRKWYQSDNRSLDFGLLDAAAVEKLVQDAVNHVIKGIDATPA